MQTLNLAAYRNIREINISDIKIGEVMLRETIDEDKIDGLAQSIRAIGTIHPIHVKATQVHGAEEFELIIGLRRLLAHQRLGRTKILGVVHTTGIKSEDKLLLALAENLQQESLSPEEEALAIFKLMTKYGMSAEEIAKRVGRADTWVRSRFKLLAVEPEVRALVRQGKLGLSHIDVLMSPKFVRSDEERLEYAHQVVEHGLTAGELRIKIRRDKRSNRTADPAPRPTRLKGKRKSVVLGRPKRSPECTDDPHPKVESGPPEISAEKVALQIRIFANSLEKFFPEVLKMDQEDQEKVLSALEDLQKKIYKGIEEVEITQARSELVSRGVIEN